MKKKFILLMSLSCIPTFFHSQVGINTETPSATLDIVSKGNTLSTKALEVNNSSATEMVTVLNNGNVGINKSAPEARLHVSNDAYKQGVMIVDNATDGGFAGIYFAQGGLVNYRGHIGYVNTGGVPFFGAPGTLQISSGNRPLIFSANNGTELFNEIARFDNVTGYFGLGTTSPKSKLEVNGFIASGIQEVLVASTVIVKTVVRLISGSAQLPRAQDNPGAIIFVKNVNNSGIISVTLPPDGGLIFPANSNTGASSIDMDGSGGGTKSLLLVSDGVNWTAMKFSN